MLFPRMLIRTAALIPAAARVFLLCAWQVFACMICLEDDPAPVPKGCGCRGTMGFAHPECLARGAVAQIQTRGPSVFYICPLCGMWMTGRMPTVLARIWVERTAMMPETSQERLAADANFARQLNRDCLFERADAELRAVHRRFAAVYGYEDQRTLRVAGYLADALSGRGLFTEALDIAKHVCLARMRLLGSGHDDTLMAQADVSCILTNMGRYDEAEIMRSRLYEETLRHLGASHVNTITAAAQLALARSQIGEANECGADSLRALVAHETRAFGAAHRATLVAQVQLAYVLSGTGLYANTAEAVAIAERTLPLMKEIEANQEASIYVEYAEAVLKLCRAEHRTCAYAECESMRYATSLCGRCRSVKYCSRRCQTLDWKRHKKVCTEVSRCTDPVGH